MTPKRAYFKVKTRRSARPSHSPTPPAPPPQPPAPARRLLIAGLAVLTALLWLYSYVTFAAGQLFLAVIIASLFEPAVSFFEKKGWSRSTGVAAVFALSALILFGVFPPFAQRLAQEAEAISSFFASKKPEQFGGRAVSWLGEVLPWLQNAMFKQRLLADYDHWKKAVELSALSLTSVLLTTWPALVLLAILILVLLAEGQIMRRALIKAVANRHLEKTVWLLHTLPTRLQQLWRAQALTACAVTALMAFAFYLMQVPCFLILGMFAGLSSLTPYFGSLLGATMALMIGVVAAGAYSLILPMLLAFATIDLMKDAAMSLRFLKAGMVLRPLETILGIIVGGGLAGVWGLFLAAPLLAVIKIVLQESLRMARDFRMRN